MRVSTPGLGVLSLRHELPVKHSDIFQTPFSGAKEYTLGHVDIVSDSGQIQFFCHLWRFDWSYIGQLRTATQSSFPTAIFNHFMVLNPHEHLQDASRKRKYHGAVSMRNTSISEPRMNPLSGGQKRARRNDNAITESHRLDL